MKHFFTFILLFIFTFFAFESVVANNSRFKTDLYSFENVLPSNANAAVMSASGSISGTNTVCQNSTSPDITFSGTAGIAPYTFTYQINGGPTLTITTTSGDNVALSVPTNVSGVYTYSLSKVTDATGQQTVLNSSVVLTVNDLPDVTLNSTVYISTIDGVQGFKFCDSSSEELFTNGSATDGTNTGYLINWGDGTSDFSGVSWSSVTHPYAVGLWTLTYTITGGSGCVVTKKFKVLVSSNAKVSFGSDNNSKDICSGSSYSFLISNTEGNPAGTIYTLTFNDGTDPIVYNTNPPASVSHTFDKSSCGFVSTTASGTYINSFSATIVASNECGSDAVTVAPIYVSTPPKAKVKLLSSKICANTPTTITDISTGSEITSADPSCKAPKRVWKITPSLGVTLTSGAYGNDFGNNSPTSWINGSTVIIPEFSIPGIYNIELIAGNFCSTNIKDTTIIVEPALLPQFTITKEGCTPFSVTAVNTTDFTNNPTATCLWEVAYSAGNCGTVPEVWSFTNSTDKNSKNPSFSFITPGAYTLKLSVFNSCGVVISEPQTVQVTKPPTVSINDIANSCDVATIYPVAVVDGCAPLSTPLTYLWTFTGGTPGTSTSLLPGAINYTTPGIYPVTLEVINPDCGSSTTATTSFTINITPVVDQPANQEVCQGTKTTDITFTGDIAGTTYTWTNNKPSIGLPATGTGNILQFTTTNGTTSVLTATINVTPTVNGCTGITKTFTVKVNPIPVITPIPNVILCTNQTCAGIPFSGSVSGTTYTWVNNTSSIGLADSGAGNIPAFTATNAGIIPIVATITVTPTANGCDGTPYTFSITVQPVSNVAPIGDVILCHHQVSESIPLSGNVAGAVYNWTNDTPSIGLAASGTGTIPSFTASNTGIVPVTATIKVTPAVNGCIGIPATYSIIVNPVVTVNDITNQMLCVNSQTIDIVFSGNISDATYDWTNSNTSIGLGASGTGTIPRFIVSNTSDIPVIATITVTPKANGCSGTPKTFTLTVNPVTTVTAIPDITLCNNQTYNNLIFTGNVAGATYTWTNDMSSIGLAGSGIGNIPSFTATNAGTDPVTATIQITPSINGCDGTPTSYKITVNPVITVNNVANQVVCTNSQTTDINFSGNIPGAIYTWTNSNVSIGLAATGTGNISQFTALNPGTIPLTGTITVTPNVNGCSGTPKTISITVNPTPDIIPVENVTLCYHQISDVVNITGNVAGTTYTWTNDTPSIGLAGSGSGDIPSFTAENTGIIALIATINITPSANGCVGTSSSYTITVNPIVIVNDVANQMVCDSAQTDDINFTGNIPGATYTWTNSNVAIGLAATGSGKISQFIVHNTGNIPIIDIITVIPHAYGCDGTPKIFTITVNPTSKVTPFEDISLCYHQISDVVNITGNVAGSSYSWVNDTPSIGLAASGNGDIPSFTAVNDGITPIVATITVTPMAFGCIEFPYTFRITVNPTVTVDDLVNQIVCDSTQIADINFSGNIPDATYTWTNSNPSIGLPSNGTGNISTFKTLNAGTNAITATITVIPQANGCNGLSKSLTLTVYPLPLVHPVSDRVYCNNELNSSIPVTGNVAGSSFTWTNDTPSIGLVASGTGDIPAYTATNIGIVPVKAIITIIPSSNGCTGTPYFFSVTVNPFPLINPQELTICNGGTFSLLPLDGNGNIVPPNTFYTWSAPVINPVGSITGSSMQAIAQNSISQKLTNTIHETATAIYTVVPVTGTCIGNPFTFVVTVNPTSDILFSIPDQIIGSGKVSQPVTFPSVTSGNVKYTWTIDVPTGISGQILPDSNRIQPQTLVNTTDHKLTVTYTVTSAFIDGSSCDGTTAGYTITVNPVITTSSVTSGFNGFNISVTGGNDGWIDVTVAGGSGTYTYTWTGPNGFTSSTQDITNLPAGDYSVTISDGYSDPVVLKFTMTDPLLLVIKEDLNSHVNIACNGNLSGTIRIDIVQSSVGPYNYLLENLSGTIVAQAKDTTAMNILFTGLPAGTYQAKVTDANGYSKTLPGLLITEPAILSATVSSVNVSCFGGNNGNATLSTTGGSGSYLYSWNTLPVQTTATATGLVAGIYTGTVTDSNGCIKVLSATITEPSDIQIVTDLKKDNTCFGDLSGEIAITVTGGTPAYDYTWTKDGLPYAKTEDITHLDSGTYTVSVTDMNSCVPKTASFTINEPPAIIINLISQNNIKCNGDSTGSVHIEAVGGTPIETNVGVFDYNYSWTGPNGFKSKLKEVTGLVAGIYILTVTDDIGCTKELQITITQPEKIILFLDTKQISCYGSKDASIKTIISGGVKPYQIIWSNLGSGTFQDNLSPGDYSVTVIDSLGCQKTATVSISQARFSIVPVITPVSCFGEHDGSISLNILGGVQPVKLVWEDNSTDGNVRNNLGPGSYTAFLSDAASCSFKQTFIVQEPMQLEVSATITNAFDCNVQNSGAISLKVTGGTFPYAYLWSNNATTGKISSIPAGSYFVTVTDSNGCKITQQYLVKRQVPITINMTSVADYNCLTKNIKEINTASITGGVPPYQLLWSSGTVSGANNEIMETTQSGMVTLQVSDGLGCTAFNSFNVDIRNPGIKYQIVDCNKFAFQFNAVVPNENESYTYSWDFGDGGISTLQNVQHVFNSSGNFTVQLILTSQSCISYYKQIVNVQPGPVLTINKIPTFCNGDSVVVHVSGAQTYRWNDNSVSDSIVIKHVGSYNVTGTSNTGCETTLSFTASLFEFNDYTIQTDRNDVTNDKKPLHLWSESIANSEYYWDFGDGKTDQGNDLTHVYDITTDGYYDVKLKIINSHGCVQNVTKRIWITQNALPNTFTPNGDGKNDIFMKNWQIQVYNRNGILLYEGKDGWDGTHKGVPVLNDTYFYVVYYSTESGSKSNTGFVTVIR